MFLSYCSVAVAAASIGVSNYNSKTADLSIMDQVAERILIDEGVQCLDFNQYYVKDLKGNVFLVKLGDNGFAIIDVKTSIPIEVQPDMECPYSFSIESKGNNYYFGFGNYFFKNGEKYRNLSTGRNVFQEYMVDYQNDFDYELKQKRKEVDLEDLNYDWAMSYEEGQESKLVHNYEILKYSRYISNFDGSCGYVASSSLLDYYNKTGYSGVVDESYYDSKNELIDDYDENSVDPNENLKDKILSYAPGCISANIGVDLQYALSQYLEDMGFRNISDQMVCLSIDKSFFKTLLDCNIPFVAGSRVRDPINPNEIYFHSFVVYGYKKIGNEMFYFANWGYNKSELVEVRVPESHIWSAVYIVMLKSSSEIKIDPNDFETNNMYCDTIKTGSVSCNLDSKNDKTILIQTEMFRTGVFQNEFDQNVFSLSCRKKAFTTAYISLVFPEPVRQIKIELSKWDYNELVDQNNGFALIKYKNLYYPDYDKIGAFLPDIANECDYEMKQWNIALDIFEECVLDGMDSTITLTINIPNKTKQIEIITQCNDVNNSSSLDKGRLCIHSMEAKIYA